MKLLRNFYSRLKIKYPKANNVFQEFKKNNYFYFNKHKISSGYYFYRLTRAEKKGINLFKVKMPNNSKLPLIFSRCEEKGKESKLHECLAIPDSQLLKRKSPEKLVEELSNFDIISFDVFDTLIFRPFANPTDLFYLLGEKFNVFNFSELRRMAEGNARIKTHKPNFEIDVYDIYEELSTMCKLKKEDANVEIKLEEEICYANPYMLKVFNLLKGKNKKIVVISDMYLPSKVILNILEKNGFKDINSVIVSCEHGCSKGGGGLFQVIKSKFGKSKAYAHVGDNESADVYGAKKAGFEPFYYTQCNFFGNQYRPSSLCSPVGSVYKGVVNNYMYNGMNKNSAREDFGFIYAGPIVSGYCEYVNKVVKDNNCDKILFMARDMDIFYKMYNKYYKEYNNEYVITSRFALQELIVEDNLEEFFFHTIKSRCNRGYTFKRAFNEINLDFLCAECNKFYFNEKDYIVPEKIYKAKNLFTANKDRIVEQFKNKEIAAKQYFKQKIGDAKKVCVVDLGWRGSIIAYLKYLLVDKWKLCESVKGVLLGTSINETSINLQSNGLVSSFCFNHTKNRDFLKNGNWEVEYINLLILESIFTSNEKSLVEYDLDKKTGKTKFITYNANPNKKIIAEFQTGITKFLEEFEKVRKSYRKYYPITAVDAYQPMSTIASSYDYISRIIGDVMDTPYAIAGLNISEKEYVPLGQLMADRKMIKQWPI